MKLVSVATDAAPDDPGFSRITGTALSDSGAQLAIWFEVPCALADQLSQSANPWLIAMLPHALTTGEAVVSDIPADPELLENLKGLVAIWCNWYPQFARPEIVAPVSAVGASGGQGTRSAAFFSGGIDSWFTVLRHAPELEKSAIGRIDDLITVHGFDIPVESRDEFTKLREVLAAAATAIGRELIVVRTNLRQQGSLWARAWGWLAHGAGLAATALILERRYGKVLIGSTLTYDKLIPWGSHPMTDALLSTASLQVKHDGASHNRAEKTALVARHDVALRYLHVCWKDGAATNCGVCAKCIRTMAALQLLGALEISNPFPVAFRAERLARLYIEGDVEVTCIEEIRDLAARMGQPTIESAASHALRRSARLRPLVKIADGLSRVPLMWRLGPRVRRWCGG